MPTSLLGPTLADLLEVVPGLDGVSAQARQNMNTGIRTLCRVLDQEPQFVPIAATALRKIFDEALPAAAYHWSFRSNSLNIGTGNFFSGTGNLIRGTGNYLGGSGNRPTVRRSFNSGARNRL